MKDRSSLERVIWLRPPLSALLLRAAVPVIRFHDLRHTAATLLLLAGENSKIVQERLGHSRIQVTLDTYSHVLPTMQRSAVDKLDKLFAEKSGTRR